MLLVLQVAHSLIYALAVLCILGAWRFALTGQGRRALPVFIGFPVLIGLGLLLNDGDCIFQSWARALSDAPDDIWVRDLLFLPEAVARRTPIIFTPPFILGVALSLHRIWRHNRLNA
ncbi:hypothetical protein OA2633_10514 [Oceanicaulis sp. HTCC2633]|uniref:hypothetical protein n=1 Tax=Oceanicaulis sp. HTCC2633 TaxID=314254 RepID=UPI0000669777|nr:hypothetical protein [Oceanicaulis sp. HTCC2633]EAP89693.1 hypothetical protein OA2633_10514 [Oceanicaulis sp. HTCC2633]